MTFHWIVITGTILLVFVSIGVQFWGPITRSHCDPSKRLFQGIKKLDAKLSPVFKHQIGVRRHIRYAVKPVDFRIHKIAHVKVLGQALSAKSLQTPHTMRLTHQAAPFHWNSPSGPSGLNGLCATSQMCPSGSAKYP